MWANPYASRYSPERQRRAAIGPWQALRAAVSVGRAAIGPWQALRAVVSVGRAVIGPALALRAAVRAGRVTCSPALALRAVGVHDERVTHGRATDSVPHDLDHLRDVAAR